MAHPRVLRRSNGTRQVQISWGKVGGKRKIEYVGSGRTDEEIEFLLVEARERINAGQGTGELDLDEDRRPGEPVEEVGSRMAVLWDALDAGFRTLGFDEAAADDVFRDLVLARIVEPASKQAAVERVLPEIGVPHASYRTLKRRLRLYSAEGFRDGLAAACARAARLGPASLLMFDVTNLWFETDKEDEFRVPGFSKERRVEPLIQIGLLTDASGMPLMVTAWEGNTAETKTMIPTLKTFMAAHRLHDVVIVADAGMISEANWKAIEAEGFSFVLGQKMPHMPYVIAKWRTDHPHVEYEDGQVWAAREPVGTGKKNRADHVTYYQWKKGPGGAHAARDRQADHQGRGTGRRQRHGEAEQVHQARRRDQVHQPRPGSQGQVAGWVQGLPTRTPRPPGYVGINLPAERKKELERLHAG